MSIDAIRRGIGLASPGVADLNHRPSVEVTKTGETKSFGEVLAQAVSEVNTLDTEAQRKIADTMSGKAEHAPHNLIVSLEKADLAFELMNKVRTQIVRAYEEIMRTQV